MKEINNRKESIIIYALYKRKRNRNSCKTTRKNNIILLTFTKKENRFIKTAFNYYTLIDIDATLHAECRCERRHE